MDEHIVVREGEQYASVINDTRLIGEEVNISYTVEIITDDLFICGACGQSCILFRLTPPLCHTSVQVEKAGDVVIPPLSLTVTYPHKSPRQNNLLYLTHVAFSPQVCVHIYKGVAVFNQSHTFSSAYLSLQVKCDAARWINPESINPKTVTPNPTKETLSVFLLVSNKVF